MLRVNSERHLHRDPQVVFSPGHVLAGHMFGRTTRIPVQRLVVRTNLVSCVVYSRNKLSPDLLDVKPTLTRRTASSKRKGAVQCRICGFSIASTLTKFEILHPFLVCHVALHARTWRFVLSAHTTNYPPTCSTSKDDFRLHPL